MDGTKTSWCRPSFLEPETQSSSLWFVFLFFDVWSSRQAILTQPSTSQLINQLMTAGCAIGKTKTKKKMQFKTERCQISSFI